MAWLRGRKEPDGLADLAQILLVRLIVGARDECADHRIVAHQVPLASPLVGRGHRSAILRVGYDVAVSLAWLRTQELGQRLTGSPASWYRASREFATHDAGREGASLPGRRPVEMYFLAACDLTVLVLVLDGDVPIHVCAGKPDAGRQQRDPRRGRRGERRAFAVLVERADAHDVRERGRI